LPAPSVPRFLAEGITVYNTETALGLKPFGIDLFSRAGAGPAIYECVKSMKNVQAKYKEEPCRGAMKKPTTG
jgi:hypothetical protein